VRTDYSKRTVLGGTKRKEKDKIDKKKKSELSAMCTVM
jgi:hypothetical protein